MGEIKITRQPDGTTEIHIPDASVGQQVGSNQFSGSSPSQEALSRLRQNHYAQQTPAERLTRVFQQGQQAFGYVRDYTHGRKPLTHYLISIAVILIFLGSMAVAIGSVFGADFGALPGILLDFLSGNTPLLVPTAVEGSSCTFVLQGKSYQGQQIGVSEDGWPDFFDSAYQPIADRVPRLGPKTPSLYCKNPDTFDPFLDWTVPMGGQQTGMDRALGSLFCKESGITVSDGSTDPMCTDAVSKVLRGEAGPQYGGKGSYFFVLPSWDKQAGEPGTVPTDFVLPTAPPTTVPTEPAATNSGPGGGGSEAGSGGPTDTSVPVEPTSPPPQATDEVAPTAVPPQPTQAPQPTAVPPTNPPPPTAVPPTDPPPTNPPPPPATATNPPPPTATAKPLTLWLSEVGPWMAANGISAMTAPCPADPGTTLLATSRGIIVDMTGTQAVAQYYSHEGCASAGGQMQFVTASHSGQPYWIEFLGSGGGSAVWVYPFTRLPVIQATATPLTPVAPEDLFQVMQARGIWYLETLSGWNGDLSAVHLYQGSDEVICACSSMAQFIDPNYLGGGPYMMVKRADSQMGQPSWPWKIWVGLMWAPFH